MLGKDKVGSSSSKTISESDTNFKEEKGKESNGIGVAEGDSMA